MEWNGVDGDKRLVYLIHQHSSRLVLLICVFCLLPDMTRYDSMHVALTDYYNHFVFENDVMHNNRALRVQRGGFIEDKLGKTIQNELFSEPKPNPDDAILSI